MNGAGGGGRVASVGMGEEGVREANVGAVRRISGVMMGDYIVGDENDSTVKIEWVMYENIKVTMVRIRDGGMV